MEYLTGLTRAGDSWVPSFVVSLDHNNCIGCGRCYKTCARDVFELVDRADLDVDDDDDDFDDDDVSMVMSLKNPGDCIGCEACSRVCPKKTITHEPLGVAA